MYIFLDTNVFYNDWFLKNPNFRYLFHFISNEDCTLLMSELVCKEAENIRAREFLQVKNELVKQWNQVRKLTDIQTDFDSTRLDIKYNLRDIVADKCANVAFFSYESVPHELLVQKAIKGEKPFTDGEKGYRDALIWLSLLTYMKESDVKDDVAFITNNKSDFFVTGAGGTQLHPQLQADLLAFGITVNVLPFESLFKFVQAVIDKSTHAIDKEKTKYDAEEFLEYEAAKYLRSSPSSEFKSALIAAGLSSTIVHEILDIEPDIMEAVEDCHILSYDPIEQGNVYVYFFFDLRIVYLNFKFPTSVYYANKDLFDVELMNHEIEGDFVYAGTCMRLYFDVSCIYNPASESYSNFTVADLRFRF